MTVWFVDSFRGEGELPMAFAVIADFPKEEMPHVLHQGELTI